MATVARRTTRRPERPINLTDQDSPAEDVRQFLTLRFQGDQITTRRNLLRDKISAHVDQVGETDEKGSKFWKLPAPIEVNGQKFTEVKRERRVSTRLDVEAVETLVAEKGIRDQVFKPVTTEVLDQDELYVLNQKGVITDAELDALWVETETFAFKPLQG
jgi:hypothetical protein